MSSYSIHAPVSGQISLNDLSRWNGERSAQGTSITPISGTQRNMGLPNSRSTLCHPTGNDFRLGKFHGHVVQVNPYGSTYTPNPNSSGWLVSDNSYAVDKDNRRIFPDAYFSGNPNDYWDNLDTTTGQIRFGDKRSNRYDIDIGLDYVLTLKPNNLTSGVAGHTLTFEYLIESDVSYNYITANVIHRYYSGSPFTSSYADDLSQGLTANGQWNTFSGSFNTQGGNWDTGVIVFNLVYTDWSWLNRGFYRMSVRNMRLTRTS